MISLDLTKSSEVRKAGDWSNCCTIFFIFLEYYDVQRTLAGEEVRILKRRACCCALWGSRAADSLSLSYPRLTSNPISVPRVLLIARCKLFYFYQCAICEINLIPKSKGLRCNVKTYEAILLLEKRPWRQRKIRFFFKPVAFFGGHISIL